MKLFRFIPVLFGALLLAGCLTITPTGTGGRMTIGDIIKAVQAETAPACKYVPDSATIVAIVGALGVVTNVPIPADIVGKVVDIICPLDQKLSQGRSARPKAVVVNGKTIRVTGKRIK